MKQLWTRVLAKAACGFCAALTTMMARPVTLPMSIWVSEPFTLMPAGGFFPDAYIASVDRSLLLTGYYVTGDYYRVYVNGNLALTTGQVAPIDEDYGDRTPPSYVDPASAAHYVKTLLPISRRAIMAGYF